MQLEWWARHQRTSLACSMAPKQLIRDTCAGWSRDTHMALRATIAMLSMGMSWRCNKQGQAGQCVVSIWGRGSLPRQSHTAHSGLVNPPHTARTDTAGNTGRPAHLHDLKECHCPLPLPTLLTGIDQGGEDVAIGLWREQGRTEAVRVRTSCKPSTTGAVGGRRQPGPMCAKACIAALTVSHTLTPAAGMSPFIPVPHHTRNTDGSQRLQTNTCPIAPGCPLQAYLRTPPARAPTARPAPVPK